MKKSKIVNHINQCEEFLLYKDDVIKSMVVLSSGCYFKMPTANTDWCADLFRIVHWLCYNWRNTYFIVSEPEHKAGCIYLYIQ